MNHPTPGRAFIMTTAMVVAFLGPLVMDPPRAHAGADPLILQEYTDGTYLLTPGQKALWPLGVTTRPEDITTLRMTLTGQGPLAHVPAELGRVTTVDVRTCSEPWQESNCPGTSRTIIEPVRLDQLGNRSAELATTSGTVPGGTYLLTTVALSDTAGELVQGAEAELRLGVHAFGPGNAGVSREGHATVGGDSDDGIHEGGSLPNTGFDIALYALLGAGAVLTGLALIRWKRAMQNSGTS